MCPCQKHGTSSSTDSATTAHALPRTKPHADLSANPRSAGYPGSVVISSQAPLCILLGIAGFLPRLERRHAQVREVNRVALVNRGERQIASLHHIVALGYGFRLEVRLHDKRARQRP